MSECSVLLHLCALFCQFGNHDLTQRIANTIKKHQNNGPGGDGGRKCLRCNALSITAQTNFSVDTGSLFIMLDSASAASSSSSSGPQPLNHTQLLVDALDWSQADATSVLSMPLKEMREYKTTSIYYRAGNDDFLTFIFHKYKARSIVTFLRALQDISHTPLFMKPLLTHLFVALNSKQNATTHALLWDFTLATAESVILSLEDAICALNEVMSALMNEAMTTLTRAHAKPKLSEQVTNLFMAISVPDTLVPGCDRRGLNSAYVSVFLMALANASVARENVDAFISTVRWSVSIGDQISTPSCAEFACYSALRTTLDTLRIPADVIYLVFEYAHAIRNRNLATTMMRRIRSTHQVINK